MHLAGRVPVVVSTELVSVTPIVGRIHAVAGLNDLWGVPAHHEDEPSISVGSRQDTVVSSRAIKEEMESEPRTVHDGDGQSCFT